MHACQASCAESVSLAKAGTHRGRSSQAGRREESSRASLRSALRSIASYACPL